MYSIGERIIYGSTGVCQVTDIAEGGAGPRYVLRPLYQDCVITVPVNSTKVFMRPLISRDEALRLIDAIPSVTAEAFHSKALRQLTDHYEEALRTHDCARLIELTMSIYEKKQIAEREKRKFGAIDERFMKRAEDLLFGELAAVLEIPRDTVRAFIAARLGKEQDEE